MGGGFEIPLGWKNRIKRPFKSDVIFIFLFQFLFTRKGFSLKHEKKFVVQIGWDFLFRMCGTDPCSINFSLCYQGLGKQNGRRFVCLKCCDGDFFSTFILGFVCGWIWQKRHLLKVGLNLNWNKLSRKELNENSCDNFFSINWQQLVLYSTHTSFLIPFHPKSHSQTHTHTWSWQITIKMSW